MACHLSMAVPSCLLLLLNVVQARLLLTGTGGVRRATLAGADCVRGICGPIRLRGGAVDPEPALQGASAPAAKSWADLVRQPNKACTESVNVPSPSRSVPADHAQSVDAASGYSQHHGTLPAADDMQRIPMEMLDLNRVACADPADHSGASAAEGKAGTSMHFMTDAEIRAQKMKSQGPGALAGQDRELEPFECDEEDVGGLLEDNADQKRDLASKRATGFDQFKVNEERFGIKTEAWTAKDEDEYTARIDKSDAGYAEQQQRAEKLAAEIERSWNPAVPTSMEDMHLQDERNLPLPHDLDEATLYSTVNAPRRGQQTGSQLTEDGRRREAVPAALPEASDEVEMESRELERVLDEVYDRFTQAVDNGEPFPPEVEAMASQIQELEGPEPRDRVSLPEPPGWTPADGWDGHERMAALRQAESRGELHLERNGSSVVHHSLDSALDHLSGVIERRPWLLQQRFDELLEDEGSAVDEGDEGKAGAVVEGEADAATGAPQGKMTLSSKLRAFLQRYQHYLEPSFRASMIANSIITDNNNTWPVDIYIYPPAAHTRPEEPEQTESDTDVGSQLLDSDARCQAVYDSDNEDETAWARGATPERPAAVFSADPAGGARATCAGPDDDGKPSGHELVQTEFDLAVDDQDGVGDAVFFDPAKHAVDWAPSPHEPGPLERDGDYEGAMPGVVFSSGSESSDEAFLDGSQNTHGDSERAEHAADESTGSDGDWSDLLEPPPRMTTQERCRFGAACTRPDCKFVGCGWKEAGVRPGVARCLASPLPWGPCKFGAACTRPGCSFDHSGVETGNQGASGAATEQLASPAFRHAQDASLATGTAPVIRGGRAATRGAFPARGRGPGALAAADGGAGWRGRGGLRDPSWRGCRGAQHDSSARGSRGRAPLRASAAGVRDTAAPTPAPSKPSWASIVKKTKDPEPGAAEDMVGGEGAADLPSRGFGGPQAPLPGAFVREDTP